MEVTRLRGTERRARRKGPAPGCLAGELQGGEDSALRSRNLGGPRRHQDLGREHWIFRGPGSGTPRCGGCLGPWAWEVAASGVKMSGTEVRVGGVSGGAGEQDGQGIRVRGLVLGVQGYGRVRVQSGEVRGPGFGWAVESAVERARRTFAVWVGGGLGEKVSEGSRPGPEGARDGTWSGRRRGGLWAGVLLPAAAPLPAAPQSAQCALPVPAACSSSSSRFLLRSRSPMAGPAGSAGSARPPPSPEAAQGAELARTGGE